MTIHRPLIEALLEGLDLTFNGHTPADKVLDKIFRKSRKFGSRDRRFLAESFYEIVRWWRPLVENVVGGWQDFDSKYSKAELQAIVDFYLKDPHPSRWPKKSRASQHSIPDWLDDVGSKELGSRWDLILAKINTPAKVYLRVNTLKAKRGDVQNQLADEGIETDAVEAVPEALVLRERKNVFQTKAYLSGLFEVQDAGSQLIAPMLKVEPKMRVIDACAGAGGKSLHIGAMMKNSGRIIAMDIHEWKLNELRKRAARSGVDTIETKVADSKNVKRNAETADRLLLDVPCSGLGVLRRNPGTKWFLSPEFLQEMRDVQAKIFDEYVSMLKPKGQVVYATCSLLPSENQNQVKAFLERHPDFKLQDEIQLSQTETDFDGFYAARLSK